MVRKIQEWKRLLSLALCLSMLLGTLPFEGVAEEPAGQAAGADSVFTAPEEVPAEPSGFWWGTAPR